MKLIGRRDISSPGRLYVVMEHDIVEGKGYNMFQAVKQSTRVKGWGSTGVSSLVLE